MVEYVAHTPRSKMTKAKAVKVFLAANGVCCLCGVQIRPGDGWFIEHVVPLAIGGADEGDNLKPAHNKCKASKDATDAAEKARRDRIVASGWADKPKTKWGSRGFQRAQPQRSATREIRRKSDSQGEAK
jgi:5-methylcytosine-specific restriction endonuclease McrA